MEFPSHEQFCMLRCEEIKLVVSCYIIHACRKFGVGFLVYIATALLINNKQIATPEDDCLKIMNSCIPANTSVGMDVICQDKYLKDKALQSFRTLVFLPV